ncbi:MAG TPA: hypothetical protein VMW50_00840 [Dehalococcoidia bacterium]|nr:hypothetical protein [Dehalococcoidia bacterium]
MADFGRGIKAGAAAGVVYLLIAVMLELTGFSQQFLSLTIAAGLGIQPESTELSIVILSIWSYMFRGIVFGAILAALYNSLPGTTSVRKGVVLSAFLWIVASIEIIYATPGWPWHDGGHSYAATYYGSTVCLSSVGLALVNIMFTLAFGALVGSVWNRLRAKELREARKGNAALLLGFALGVWMWVLGAVTFFMNVVVRGFPVIEQPGPFWWYSILFVSDVFLGLPGWVLALVAWRKTKVDKSGFRWGVAGGVMMALTGIMLLPGILAIIGGVLSGRKPTSEPSAAAIGQ